MNIEYTYGLACFVIPCLIWQAVNWKKIYKKQYMIRHIIWTYIFIFYAFVVVIDAARIGTIWDFVAYKELYPVINIIPFSSEGAMTYILNVAMTVPLGFLLPLIWKEFRKFYLVLLAGLGFSLIIEILQLFNHRVSDIDDLLMNTIGAMVGFGIWFLFQLIFKKAGDKATSICKAEAIIYLALGTAGVFLLYNWRIF